MPLPADFETHVPAVKRVNGAGLTPSGGPYAVFSAEAYLILTPEPVLIDCGGPLTTAELRANLESLNVRPADLRLVIATHFHSDHTGNIVGLRRESRDIPFAIHTADVQPFVAQFGPEASAPSGRSTAETPPRVDRVLTDGERFAIGRATFEIIHTPGHTAGSAAVLVAIDDTRALFVGDTVHGLCFVRPGTDVWALLQQWSGALERLAACPFDWMFEGHVLPVHVLGNPTALSQAEQAEFYRLLERRMDERRRGIRRDEALHIIAAQREVLEAGLLITPETWISEMAKQLEVQE